MQKTIFLVFFLDLCGPILVNRKTLCTYLRFCFLSSIYINKREKIVTTNSKRLLDLGPEIFINHNSIGMFFNMFHSKTFLGYCRELLNSINGGGRNFYTMLYFLALFFSKTVLTLLLIVCFFYPYL